MSQKNQNRLLVIDDERGICEFVGEVATDLGFDARLTTRVEDFRAQLRSFEPSLVALDLQMPDVDGIELLRELAAMECSAQVIVMSGMDARVLATAERLGKSLGLKMLGVLSKPMMLDELESTLDKALVNGRHISAEELEEALSDGQIQVYYQPQVYMHEGEWVVNSAEALARWRHPRFGLVLPDEFIPLAEESGLIGPLTDHVFRTVVAQVKEWSDEGHKLRVAVNCSAHLLNDLRFPDRVSDILKQHGVDPALVMVELTESAAMSDPQVTMDILARLRVKNLGLSVDDFGTGFSSLKQLYRMPFNELKIDCSFVRDMTEDAEALTIVETVIYLAKKLGMRVCAEGVESPEALAMLAELECDTVQGYLVSPPVPASRFLEVSAKWSKRGVARFVPGPDSQRKNVVQLRSTAKSD
jgi:EAL domain-containing protein (putative c-di-GMP-specific phosphodiesterase class I)/CheY-like chemotaxis protein